MRSAFSPSCCFLAKIDAGRSGGAEVLPVIDLSALARDLTADHVPGAAEAGIDLGFEGDAPVMVSAEPLLVGELLGNLVEKRHRLCRPRRGGNGARLAGRRSGGGGRRTGHRARTAGSGAPALCPRGQRSSGPRPRQPIVEEIAARFGARLELERGAGERGLKARVVFPLARDQKARSGQR